MLSAFTTILSSMLERLNRRTLGDVINGIKMKSGRDLWASIDPDLTLSDPSLRVPAAKALLRFLGWTGLDHHGEESFDGDDDDDDDDGRDGQAGSDSSGAKGMTDFPSSSLSYSSLFSSRLPSMPPKELLQFILDEVWHPSRKDPTAHPQAARFSRRSGANTNSSSSSSSSSTQPRGWPTLTTSQVNFVERVERQRRLDGSWYVAYDALRRATYIPAS